MDPDISKLLHDKRFWVAGGVAAALGLGVWWQRRAAGSGSAPASGKVVSGGAGGLGSFDSTGADIAGALGEQTGQIQDVLQQFLNQLESTQAGAAQIPTAQTPAGPIWNGPIRLPYAPAPAPGRVPSTPPSWAPSASHTVTVVAPTRTKPGWDTTLQALEQLNPGIRR